MSVNIKISYSKDFPSTDYKTLVVAFSDTETLLKRKIKEYSDYYNLQISNQVIADFKKSKNNSFSISPKHNYLNTIEFNKLFNNDDISTDYFRDYSSKIIKQYSKLEINKIIVDLNGLNEKRVKLESYDYLIQTIIEGFYLGAYSYDSFLTKDKSKNVKVILHCNQNINKIIKSTAILMDSVKRTKDLVNDPPNILTPRKLSNHVRNIFKQSGVKVKTYSKQEILANELNLIHAVGKASVYDPLLIEVKYKPKKNSAKKIVLVGKGVTFDSGGLSIKPSSGMLDMKTDMAGAAVVIGVLKAVSDLQLPVEVIGVIPVVENVINGNAYKPGDVIRSGSGKTVEVIDTDAEGRLILADALYHASKIKPDQIIDFATLTGAMVVALGEFAAGMFCTDDDMAKKLIQSSQKVYELVWQMPLWKEYEQLIESDIADIKNLGPRWGGGITAAKFLQAFVKKEISWAHLDIAGPASQHKNKSYTEKFATGFGVRMIVDYLQKL